MPRLRVTVSLALTAQEFFLDAPVISIGKLPDSVLVLPFAWVGETHLIISDDPSGAVRVKAPSELRKASMNGLPISAEGLLVPLGQTFAIGIPSPAGDPLILNVAPSPAAVVPTIASTAPKSRLPFGQILGAAVLVGVTLLVSYVAFSSPASIPRAATLPPPTPAQLESRHQLDAAAAAYLSGDLPAARLAIANSSETGLLADALSKAIRHAENPTPKPNPTNAPPNPQPPKPAPDRVDFEGKSITPAQRDKILEDRAIAATAERVRQQAEAARAQTTPPTTPPAKPGGDPNVAAAILARAADDIAAGKSLKQTDTGKRALAHAKDLVKKQLASDIAFPPDDNANVIVSLTDDQIQIRGFCDQYNAQHIPLRVFYLVKLRPLDETQWNDIGVEMLK
jgi:hypothetical protein